MSAIKHLDANDSLRLGAHGGVYEPAETAVVRRFVRPGQVFVDVGAHIGYYSAMAAELVGPQGTVFAFEPDPENALALEANLSEVQPRPAWKIYRAAVSDFVGHARLFLCERNSGDHRLYGTEGRKSRVVNVLTLDSVQDLRFADFIKVDVQGTECHVLRGARRLLLRSEAVVGMIEFSPAHLRLAGSTPEEFLVLMSELGFRLHVCREGRLVRVRARGFPLPPRYVNIFFSRRPLT